MEKINMSIAASNNENKVVKQITEMDEYELISPCVPGLHHHQ
jgi:hypothetical protein